MVWYEHKDITLRKELAGWFQTHDNQLRVFSITSLELAENFEFLKFIAASFFASMVLDEWSK